MDYQLIHNTEKNRYEFDIKDEVAVMEYQPQGDVLIIVHTGVPQDLENQGIAHQLVQKSLDDIRANDQQIIPVCPYVVTFIDRNPEYSDLIPNL